MASVRVGSPRGWGGLPYKKDRGARYTFYGVTKSVLLPLRVFSLKRSTMAIEPKKI